MGLDTDLYNIEINGVIRDVKYVTAFSGLYQNPTNGLWYAVTWIGEHRAAFRDHHTAIAWCNDANRAYSGLPRTNKEIEHFNDAMKLRNWRVASLLGDCQLWEPVKPAFDAAGRHREGAGAA